MGAFLVILGVAVMAFALMWAAIVIFGNRPASPTIQVVAASADTTTTTATTTRSSQTGSAIWLHSKKILLWSVIIATTIVLTLWLVPMVLGWFGALDAWPGDWWGPDDIPPFWSWRSTWFLIFLFLLAVFLSSKGLPKWAALAGMVIILVVWWNEGLESFLRRTERIINHGEWSASDQSVGSMVVPAGRSGSTIAPTTGWSEWRKFDRTGLCFRIWTANPDLDDVRIRYIDLEGEKWSYGGGYIADAVAISFISKIGMPVRTYYETWTKTPGKGCVKA